MACLNRFALVCALSSFSVALPVVAQTNPPVEQTESSPSIQVEVLPPDKNIPNYVGLRMQLRQSDIKNALQTLALYGRLQVRIRPGVEAKVDSFDFSSSPRVVLQALCQKENLECQLRRNVWFVSPQNKGLPKMSGSPLIDSMFFRDTDAVSILQTLSQQFSIKIRIEPDVDAKIAFLSLVNQTPRQAIEILALTARLDVREENDTLIISKKVEVEKTAPVPEGDGAKFRLLSRN